jgi:hypothetical protein
MKKTQPLTAFPAAPSGSGGKLVRIAATEIALL